MDRPGLRLCLRTEATQAAEKKYADPVRFEKNILAFEAKDEKSPPPRGAIVCTGSSSMVGWHGTIAKDLAPLTVIPRGFGGSTMNDAVHYADRVVTRYQPRAVVLYEGDNDIAGGIAPERFIEVFRALTAKIHKTLPEARIYVLSIKPSPSRWALWPKMQQANKLLEAECAKDKRLVYVSIVEGMLGPDGKPREEIFKQDRLHMNEKGYEILARHAAAGPHEAGGGVREEIGR